MIFTKHHIQLIQTGCKTQTRRFWKKPRVKVGKTYKLQTQFFKKENLGSIRIIGLRQKALGSVTQSDARKLGYSSKSAYLTALAEIRRKKLKPSKKVWAIDFEFCT